MINFSNNITGIVNLGLVKISLFFYAYVKTICNAAWKGRKTWGFDS